MTHIDRLSLLITSGDGPAECRQAVQSVLTRMKAEAAASGLSLDAHVTPAKHGPKSAIVVLHGANCADFAQQWCGTIRWRAKSTLRPQHKRANWFIGVFQIGTSHTPVELLPQDVSFETFRAGGPGGQHQNTTESAVRAVHRPTGLSAIARDERSQHRNKPLALARLKALMAAQEMAQAEASKVVRNKMHHALARGNPIRSFKGAAFQEEAC